MRERLKENANESLDGHLLLKKEHFLYDLLLSSWTAKRCFYTLRIQHVSHNSNKIFHPQINYSPQLENEQMLRMLEINHKNLLSSIKCKLLKASWLGISFDAKKMFCIAQKTRSIENYQSLTPFCALLILPISFLHNSFSFHTHSCSFEQFIEFINIDMLSIMMVRISWAHNKA